MTVPRSTNSILSGTRAGVRTYSSPNPKHPVKACARCGRVRGYRPGDKGNRSDLCADCRWVDPDFGKKSY